MSFLSVLKKIGHGIEVGLQVASPFIGIASSFVPGGSLAFTVLNSISGVEQVLIGPGNGAQKQAAAIALINQAHPGLNQAQLTSAVNAFGLAMNTLATAVPVSEQTPTPAPAPPV